MWQVQHKDCVLFENNSQEACIDFLKQTVPNTYHHSLVNAGYCIKKKDTSAQVLSLSAYKKKRNLISAL